MKKLISTLTLSTALTVLLLGAAPAGASSAELPPVEATCHPAGGNMCPKYEIIDVRRAGGFVETPKPIASCTVATGGGTCTITSGKTITRTVSVALGADIGFVKGQLTMSYADAEITSVSCASPPLAAGQTWAAWGMGNQYRYKVKRWYLTSVGPTIPEISTELRAFDPDGTQIYCGLA
ncbi:hypothetical protein [Microbacterium phyllosphaerae]|uniref:hypothetical protein n=1 Tax=Microbacterium phyllosphaerae TaxID=124798 RepID=UPI00216AA9F9|nr:hypothetical protein [Microbacterium phyllosphaerae]MCS3442193.1 hypothetical protein [Microbacterium phyllosphaerae]